MSDKLTTELENAKKNGLTKVIKQQFKLWGPEGFMNGGYSLHSTKNLYEQGIFLITLPDVIVPAFERKTYILDEKPEEIDIESLSLDELTRIVHAHGNQDCAVMYSSDGHFLRSSHSFDWSSLANYWPNVETQGKFKMICASYSSNNPNMQCDAYSLHVDLYSFKEFISENKGKLHGFIKPLFETYLKSYDEEFLLASSLRNSSSAFQRQFSIARIEDLKLQGAHDSRFLACNNRFYFGNVYQAEVDKKTAKIVLSCGSGLFRFGLPPAGISPVKPGGELLHHPKNFMDI